MVLVVNNFRAGEISARVDRLKSAEIVQNGLLKAQNVVINPQGGARKRPGLKYITTLPTGKQWRRIFAWDKSQDERLNICYADDGTFKVLQEGGALIDVSGKGNIGAGDDMQFQIVGNRAVFTDGREPKHILANPLNVSPQAILLTSDDITGFPVKPLRDFTKPLAQAGVDTDLYVPPADQPISLSAFRAADKSAVLEVGELRSTFTPDAAGRATVFTNNPRTYKQGTGTATITINSINREGGAGAYRLRLSLSSFPAWLEKVVVRFADTALEFTANNTTANITDAEKDEWERDSVTKSVELVRRDGFTMTGVEQGRWNAGFPDVNNASYRGGGSDDICVSNAAVSGSFPANTSWTWRLRQVGGGYAIGALTITIQDANSVCFRIGTAAEMQAAFGNANITSGGQWILDRPNLSTRGLEANDRDFFALATSGGNGVYIRGRDFYTYGSAGGLVRQPLKNRRVTGVIVLSRADDVRAAVLLREYNERILPRITNGNYKAATLAALLQVSDFIAFRPPILNPPVILFDDDSAFTAEETRIGKRFCIRTDQISGGSLTAGEYELEWVANVPVDEYGSQLTPVGTNGSARPELARRGITDIYEDRATNPPTERVVTGWKYGTSGDIPANLRSTIVENNAGDDPFNNTAIDEWGTLVARKIADNAATIGKPPGRYAMVWNDTDGYPVTASLPQNRLAYAGSRTHPARIWMSVIGQPHNFLDFRPEANDAKGIVVRPDYAVRLDLDTAAIRQMENDAALLIFTQNEAHVANGPFNAENLASSHTRRFGRLGQEFNIGSAIIDENVFIFANGAPFGLLYDGIDIGYISQNLSAQRNDDIMRNYDDRTITEAIAGAGQNRDTPRIHAVNALADLSAIGSYAEAATDESLRPVRIVATQPQGLNGAYLVLFLMSDGTIRAFQTLHREGFFAWARWDFFADENRTAHENDEGRIEFYADKIGDERRKIIDISAQGRLVTLLDNRGNIYTLDGEQAWDDLNAAAVAADDSDKHEIGVEIELPTYALADPRFPGQALIHPKRVEYAVLHFNLLSGISVAQATDSELKTVREIPAEPSFAGVAGRRDNPQTEKAQTIFLHAQRRVQMSQAQDHAHDSDKRFTITITNTGKEPFELLRAESQLEVGSLYPADAVGRSARIRGGGV